MRVGVKHTMAALTARNSDSQSGSFLIGPCDRVYFQERVSATGDAGNSVVLYYEYEDPDDSQWYPLANSDVLSTAGTLDTTALDTPPAGANIRVRWDVTIAAGTLTFSVMAREAHGG
jgi:hypothetical protein